MKTRIADNYFMETARESDALHYYLFEEIPDILGHCRCVCDGLVKTEKEAKALCELWLQTCNSEKENHG
jgi:hypothetical protein